MELGSICLPPLLPARYASQREDRYDRALRRANIRYENAAPTLQPKTGRPKRRSNPRPDAPKGLPSRQAGSGNAPSARQSIGWLKLPIADLARGSSEPAQKGASRLSYCRYRMAGGAESCNFANGIVANHLPADGGGARRRGWASVAPADNRRRSGGDTRPRYCRAVRRNR